MNYLLLVQKKLIKIISHIKLYLLLVSVMVLVGACGKAILKVKSPAQINANGIRNVAVGRFEVGLIRQRVRTERNGQWQVHELVLDKKYHDSISRAVRAQVINLLSITPFFRLNFNDEFSQLENDAALQELVSVKGYTTDNIDAVISGKLWIDLERTDGVDLTKEDLDYFRPPIRGNRGLNLNVQQVVWWPFKSTRGTLGLEIKMTRLIPTEVVAVSFETRNYSNRLGGSQEQFLQKAIDGLSAFRNSSPQKRNDLEITDQVLISFDQMIAEMASSVAAAFVKKVAVTEKTVFYPIAKRGLSSARILIEEGAYELAIEQLQLVTAQDADHADVYNLGLCFEANGDYGLALNHFREAWREDLGNLVYAQGIGRIERIRRELPQLRRQLQKDRRK